MKWDDNQVRNYGTTMQGHAFIGALTCGHERIIDCHPDDAIPTDVPCPVCDEGRSVPKGWVWDDSKGAAVDMRPPKPRKPAPDKAVLMERSPPAGRAGDGRCGAPGRGGGRCREGGCTMTPISFAVWWAMTTGGLLGQLFPHIWENLSGPGFWAVTAAHGIAWIATMDLIERAAKRRAGA